MGQGLALDTKHGDQVAAFGAAATRRRRRGELTVVRASLRRSGSGMVQWHELWFRGES